VKASILLDKVADEEKIEVSDEEIDKEVTSLALQTKQSEASVRARLNQEGALERIKARIRSEKTLDFLYNQSA